MPKVYIIHIWDKRSGFHLNGGDLPYEFVDPEVCQEICDYLNQCFGSSFHHVVGGKSDG